MPGLRSKAFTHNPGARDATNFYVWDSKEAARAFFTNELLERITGLYGVRPSVDFVQIATLVGKPSPVKLPCLNQVPLHRDSLADDTGSEGSQAAEAISSRDCSNRFRDKQRSPLPTGEPVLRETAARARPIPQSIVFRPAFRRSVGPLTRKGDQDGTTFG